MYEQDYVMRMNRDVIRTIVKLVLNRDTDPPIDITSDELKSEDKRMLVSLNGQIDIGEIKKLEKEILELVINNKDNALERALLFYTYLNEQSDEFLLSNNFSRENIKSGLKFIASHYGISSIIDMIYL